MSGDTVTVKMLTDQFIAEGHFGKGKKYDVSPGLARRFVNKGHAENLTPFPLPPKPVTPKNVTGGLAPVKDQKKGEK